MTFPPKAQTLLLLVYVISHADASSLRGTAELKNGILAGSLKKSSTD
jgi:hypothetical protein